MLRHYATRTSEHLDRWKCESPNVKSPKCELCEKIENMNHLHIEWKRSRKIWIHFQKNYKNLTQKEDTPMQHILIISAISLPPEAKKLLLTLPTTILTHIWKTSN